MQYNPFDLISLIINGHDCYGRPIAFDSDIVNQETSKNSFDKYVKPIQISTTCPDCGQGLILDVRLSDPPFAIHICNCPLCRPIPPPMLNPFTNPIISSRISENELDPLLHNINSVQPDINTTVSQRIKQSFRKQKEILEVKKVSKEEIVNDFKNSPDDNKPKIELAEEMGVELEFDDEFVEP